MKRFVTYMLLGCMTFSVFGCNKQSYDETDVTTEETTVEETTTAESTTETTGKAIVNKNSQKAMTLASNNMGMGVAFAFGNLINSLSSKVDKEDGKVKLTVSYGDSINMNENTEEINETVEGFNSLYDELGMDITMSVVDNKVVFDFSEESYNQVVEGYDMLFSFMSMGMGDGFSCDDDKVNIEMVIPDEETESLEEIDCLVAMCSLGRCIITGADFSDFKISNKNSNGDIISVYDIESLCADIEKFMEDANSVVENDLNDLENEVDSNVKENYSI